MAIADESHPSPDTIGHKISTISVEIGTQFLEQFSEHLYSSPQKALEELIANGWDAGARLVDVRVDPDLTGPNATISVFDDGSSMDAEGLQQLWHIAFSPKVANPMQHGRRVIGKFGIGKLATYVLAEKLTYICRDECGTIRRVTMDYGEVERKAGATTGRLLSDLELDLFEVTQSDVDDALQGVYQGDAILDLIHNPDRVVDTQEFESEYGGEPAVLSDTPGGTWTVVILSGLKPAAHELRLGVLRRMLAAALPLGSEMQINVNGQPLTSSKAERPTMGVWTVGPDLGIDEIEIDENASPAESDGDRRDNEDDDSAQVPKQVIQVKHGTTPYPFVEIDGLGRITGEVRLFEDRISGGKSDERGASNGFHVNVLGRVVNQNDPSFGEKNLSHAAWARFRMAVRVDGLNQYLTTDREKFREQRELKLFRAFLRKAFNKARTTYDAYDNANLPDGGDLLVRSLGVLSLNPLRNVVSDALATSQPMPTFLDDTGIEDRSGQRHAWREETSDNIKNAVEEIKYEALNEEALVTFRIRDSTIVVNSNHPFVVEFGRTKAEKELVRTIAMVTLLTDMYALEAGVPPATLDSVRDYRDRLMRYRSMQRRESGVHIARLLLEAQHESSNSKLLELVVSDALRYLGFSVRDLAKSGEPEGIASAYTLPSFTAPTTDVPHPALYSFSFDAKSSKHAVAATNNINLAGVVQHRNRYQADYALVIAPGYSDGSIVERCREERVTPITAHDLGRLLDFTAEYGALPLTKLRELFTFHDSNEVTAWVDEIPAWIQNQRALTIDIFLRALAGLRGKVPDVLAASTIAFACRELHSAPTVQEVDVIAVATGLSILVPDLVGVDGDKIVVNANPERVADAVATQLEHIREYMVTAPNQQVGNAE